MRSNLLPIAQEGFRNIGISSGLFLIFTILDFDLLSFIILIFTLFLLYTYRNPEREMIEYEQKSVVSPVDGTVVSIEDIKGDVFAYKLTIDSTFLDVGVLRVPMNSTLLSSSIQKGARLSGNTSLAKKINENSTLIFEDSSLNKVKIKHQTKNSLADISVNILQSKNLLQTARYGFMANGVTTLYLPQNFRVKISVGDEIKASENLIGYFS